jgi:hypothetical protein
VDASINRALSEVDSDVLLSVPGTTPDALNLSPTVSETRDDGMVQVTMNIGTRGPQLHIVNGGLRLPGGNATATRLPN